MKPDEKALLDSVMRGDPGAFEALLERYRALIFSVFYGGGFAFPHDYVEDLYQSFVLALAAKDYHKLRAFTGRNNCSLATFLQIVATRFALDELRKWKRHPRGRGAADDEDSYLTDIPDLRRDGPQDESLDQERTDIFHNLLFALEWKRISAILWVFQGVDRETVADVMATSRANIDALYKRGKDQMTVRFAEGTYSRERREADAAVLTPAVSAALRELLPIPTRRLRQALLQPGAKVRALIGLLLIQYPQFRCSEAEFARLTRGEPVEGVALSVLEELSGRVLP